MFVKVFRVLKGNYSLLFLNFLHAALAALTSFIPLWMIAELGRRIIQADVRGAVIALCAFLSLIAIFNFATELIWKFLSESIVKYNNKKVSDLNEKGLKVPYEFLQNTEFKSRINEAKDILYYEYDYTDLYTAVVSILQSVFEIVLAISLVLHLIFSAPSLTDRLLSCGIFLPLIIAIVVQKIFYQRLEPINKNLIESHSEIERSIVYYIMNIVMNYAAYPIYAIYDMFPFLKLKIEACGKENQNYFFKSRGLKITKYKVQGLSTFICLIFIYALVIYRAMKHEIEVEMILPYIQAFSIFNLAIANIFKTFMDMKINLPYIDKFEEIIAEKEEKVDGVSIDAKLPPVWSIENVSYKYPNSNKYALQKVNLQLSGESLISLVGENGSGKSTLLLLLTGLINPSEGRILYKGIDLKDINIKQYREELAIAFQNDDLLSLSLEDNLYFDKPENRERSLSLLKKLDLQNIDKLLEEEDITDIDLSGGEVQKVQIARVLARDFKLAILDEANSALDVFAAEKLYLNLLELVQNRLAIFITHQLRVAKDSKRIIMLAAGRVVGDGSHNDLLSRCEEYRNLWQYQQELFTKGIREI